MNKYLKILALSSGLIGAIAPTAINMDKNNNDVVKIYENIEKMQNAIPKLSRINYQLNTDFEQDKNVAFIATDDTGEQTELDNSETINYLNETLEQTNIEYEQLKTTLTCAIKDTMDYLDAYKNGETELTNEQKIYIKEHSNSIKYLAETLEDLSKEVIMTIDGCEDCDNDEQFNETTSKYITAINGLETRIQTLQNALHSLQFINNMCNPYFYAGYGYAHNFINGFNHDQDENNSEDLDTNIDNNLNDTDTNAGQDNNALDNNSTNDTDNNSTDNSENDATDNNKTNNDISTEPVMEVTEEDSGETDEKPTTFGLKSNIDTYAPTKRNIDTFFNTALYNNEYGYGGGYNMPYGYGYGGYGYGMPYGGGYYGNPYGMSGLNSNAINREVMNSQNIPASNNTINNNINTSANIENETHEEVTKPKKIHAKRAKNIDTYTGTTIQSNVNTMGESKISKFFKEKFNNLRGKIRKQKQEMGNNQLPTDMQDATNQDVINEPKQTDIVDNTVDSAKNMDSQANVDTYDNSNKDLSTNQDGTTSTNISAPDDVAQEKQIKAK